MNRQLQSGFIQDILTFCFVFLFVSSCGQGLCHPDGCGAAAPGVTGASSIENPDGSVTVTITGSGFVSGMTVIVNGYSCTNVIILSSIQLNCTLPNGSIALVNIILTTPDGSSGGSSTLTSPLVSSIATGAVDAGGEEDNGDAWINETNALTNDGTYASLLSPASSHYSGFLTLKGFFSKPAQALPPTATITGIKMNCYWRASSGSGSRPMVMSLKLTDGTSTGNEKATFEELPLSFAVSNNYGGDGDTWGLSLTPAIVNSQNFGIVLQIETGTSTRKNPWIDYCTLTAHFH